LLPGLAVDRERLFLKETVMAKLRPLYDHVVVERSEAEERTPGGIVLPDTAKDKPKQGTVVSVGTGRRLEDGRIVALDLKAGDKVLFGAYSGSEVKVDGKDYLILKEAEVLAVVEGGK
jgi:chaperonin GroES